MKILFFSHLTEEFKDAISLLREKWCDHQFICATDRQEYEEEIADADVLIYGNPSEETVKRAEMLKLVIVPYAGVAQLNIPFLRERNVRIANSHGNAVVVAERAVGLALACCGRIVEFHRDMSRGNWHRTGDPGKPFDYWFSIIGKKVTVLGTGAIGKNIASLLKGFGCSITGFRKSPGDIPGFDNVTTDLDEALSSGDVVFAALPMTDKTDNLISGEKMPLLKGKYIINVGRGSLIEEEPFFKALESGQIAGAALDAWYQYPTKSDPNTTGSEYPFHLLPNVVISPHAASHAPEGKAGQLAGAIEVLDTFLKEGRVLNEVSGSY